MLCFMNKMEHNTTTITTCFNFLITHGKLTIESCLGLCLYW